MAVNRRQQLQLDRMGGGTQYDSPDYFWGTAAPLTPYLGNEVDESGNRLRAPGSGPETFTRNGTDYTRGYNAAAFTGPNAWMLQQMIRDPEFGDAIPTSIVPQYQVQGESFLDKFAPMLGMAAFGLPAAIHALGAGAIGGGGAIGEGLSPTLAQVAGPTTDFNMAAAANAGDLAALGGGETFLPGVMDQVPTNLGAMGGGSMPMGVSSLMQNWDPNADYNEYFSGNYGTPAAVAPGVSQATGNLWPALSAAGTGASLLKGNSNADQTASLLKQLGLDISPAALGMLGTGLSTGLGAYAANQQANALQNIANQARNDRQPFLNDALDMLQNPGNFYQRPEVMGAVDASLRGLSAKVGNPYNNPGGLAQQAAYNLGMYNNALTSRANLGLAGQDLTSKLQTNAALANNGVYNALGSGLGSMLSTQPNYQNVLADILARSL